MKFSELKKGLLFKHKHLYYLVISNRLIKNHIRGRKRLPYYKVIIYYNDYEKTIDTRFTKAQMRADMKIVEDKELAKKIYSKAIIEAL